MSFRTQALSRTCGRSRGWTAVEDCGKIVAAARRGGRDEWVASF